MKKEENKPVIIGNAVFRNFQDFLTWCNSEAADEFFSVKRLWTPILYGLQGTVAGVDFGKLYDKGTRTDGYYESQNRKRYYVEPLQKYVDYIQEFSDDNSKLAFDLLYEHEAFDVIAFGNWQFLIPAGWLEKTLFKDYSDVPLGNLKQSAQLTGKQELTIASPALSTRSVADLQSDIQCKTKSIENILQDEDDVKNARVGELASLQAEIEKITAELEKRKQSLLAELEKKKAEMDAMKKQLETELFILESEIYSIRCYTGEVIQFVHLTSGKEAPHDMPITLFQKLRFLDEEFGKAYSLYDFDFKNEKLFEKLLKTKPSLVELFCPNEKCVALIRVSKTEKHYDYIDTPIGVILDTYEVYHGKKIGILIRNGENLYLGWTDDEKINIPEDMFFTPSEKTVSDEDADEMQNTPIKEMVSRYFVFNILQGALDNKNMLSLPNGVTVSLSKPSEYVVFSTADNALEDNRYGTFAEMIERVNSRISVGDSILALEALRDGKYSGGIYGCVHFNRDHNFSHRTGDVHLKDGGIYKINLIENDNGDLEYYVSLVKNGPDYIYRNGDFEKRKRDAYARFRVDSDEFINLTYLNSAWLQYVITTKHLGGYGRMNNYAEVIRYLNKALTFVKEREKTEKALIEQHYPKLSDDTEWMVKLSEWKLEKGVRQITDYQAKRFVTYLKNTAQL